MNGGLLAALRVVAGAMILSVAGCGLPAVGPAGEDVVAGPIGNERLPYFFVDLTPDICGILSARVPDFYKQFAVEDRFNGIRLGVGDVVSLTLFEAGPGGLFVPREAGVRPGNYVTLPNQSVDDRGNLSVPYAGLIRAKGRTIVELQNAIVAALKNKALEPQAIVTIVDQKSSQISVLGEVNAPTRFPASPSGERLLDAITRAGGTKTNGYDTWVLLDRGGVRGAMPFGALVYEPENNVYVHPRDTIFLYRDPHQFVAFGALGAAGAQSQGTYPFDAWRLNLAEALGKAGGLNDNLAEPSFVFVYRAELRQTAQQMGIDLKGYAGEAVPIIYRIDLRDPSGYFLATRFQMRNHDVIYASNARTVEATKFMNYIRTVNATVQEPINTGVSFFTMRSLILGGSTATAVTVGGTTVP